MPLWTSTSGPDRCGWAFCSDGLPCVAQRVWPIPTVPCSPAPFTVFSRLVSLPTLRRTSIFPSQSTARPAESYPRYSSRFSPSSGSGTASWLPLYPMMPHMAASSALVFPGLLPPRLSPARLNHLSGPPERQRVRRDILRHDRARRDHGPAPDRDRRHQGHVAADEGVFPDHRPVLVVPVIVARDGARTDIDAAADLRVAEVAQVVGLGARAQLRLLQFHEIPHLRPALDDRPRPQVRERADRALRFQPAPFDHAAVQHRDTVSEHALDEPAVRADHAVFAD